MLQSDLAFCFAQLQLSAANSSRWQAFNGFYFCYYFLFYFTVTVVHSIQLVGIYQGLFCCQLNMNICKRYTSLRKKGYSVFSSQSSISEDLVQQ